MTDNPQTTTRKPIDIYLAKYTGNHGGKTQTTKRKGMKFLSEAEARLLVWSGVLHLRITPLSPDEADEIDSLIARVRKENDL